MSTQKLSRRDFLRLSAGGASVAFLAACQAVPAASPGAGGSQAPGEQAVEVLYWGHNHEPRVALDAEYIALFMEENPNITVVQETPGEFNTMLPTALAAGTAADLFAHTTSGGYLSEYQRQDAIVPVNFEAFGMDEASFMDMYIEPESTMAGAIFEGELYGIPNEVSIYSLHINNQLFEEGGLDPATDYPKTWSEFTRVAEQLTKREDGQLVQRGALLGWKTPGITSNIFGGQLRQIGGAEVTEDYTQAAINSPEAVRVMEFWKYFNDNGLDGPQYPQDQSQMLLGNVAMWMNTGSWRRSGLLDSGIEYTVYPLPRWEDATSDSGCYIYAYFHMVNARSNPTVQEAAWKLAWELDSHPGEYLDRTGLLQTQKRVVESDPFQNTPFLNVFLEEMTVSHYAPSPPGWGQIVDSLDRMRDRMVEGTAIEATLATAEEEINEILERAWRTAG
jgi:multiple sugar transport system substrate-binding protein